MFLNFRLKTKNAILFQTGFMFKIRWFFIRVCTRKPSALAEIQPNRFDVWWALKVPMFLPAFSLGGRVLFYDNKKECLFQG